MIRKFWILWLLVWGVSSSCVAAVKIKLNKIENFSLTERQKLMRVVSHLEKVINTETFSSLVITHKTKGELRFEDNNGDTNEIVLKKLLDGSEILNNDIDSTWDLSLNLAFILNPSVLAYTTMNKPDIYISRRYFISSQDATLAGTICHEYSHKLGYSHTKKATPTRPLSVPYAVGSICESLYINLNENDTKAAACGFLCIIKRLFNDDTERHK